MCLRKKWTRLIKTTLWHILPQTLYGFDQFHKIFDLLKTVSNSGLTSSGYDWATTKLLKAAGRPVLKALARLFIHQGTTPEAWSRKCFSSREVIILSWKFTDPPRRFESYCHKTQRIKATGAEWVSKWSQHRRPHHSSADFTKDWRVLSAAMFGISELRESLRLGRDLGCPGFVCVFYPQL